jgi:hypothetical protein
MVFIDWISTPAHKVFNQGLFFSLNRKNLPLYIYSEELTIPEQLSIYRAASSNRVLRALSVLKTCYKHRRQPIFLLTYDPLVLPLAVFFCRAIFVFEHNTTPEGKTFFKHALWQRLFLRGVTRFAQSLGQFATLRELGQRVVFLGSPLLECRPLKGGALSPLLVAPSNRLEVAELSRFAAAFLGYPIIVRASAVKSADAIFDGRLRITPVDWIHVDSHLANAKAIVVTATSGVRVSGWFNEAIRYCIPLVITSQSAQHLFENIYPGYPYLRAQELEDSADLNTKATNMQKELLRIGPEYVARYNESLRRRCFQAMEKAGWETAEEKLGSQ